MAALTKDRATQERDGRRMADPLAPGAVIHAGAVYGLDAQGRAVPLSVLIGVGVGVIRGVATARAAAAEGDTYVTGATGVFRLANDATNPVPRGDIGSVAVFADDQTCSTTGTLSGAPKVFDVDDAGVWVLFQGVS